MSEFKLVPARMLLDKETIGAINFHCGDGGDNFGEHSDGLLWVGVVTDDDGAEVYGLHLATAEYPEEGSTTLVEFQAPEDADQSELAGYRAANMVLRDELKTERLRADAAVGDANDAERSLAAAEQRNAEQLKLISLIRKTIPAAGMGASWAVDLCERIDRLINPKPARCMKCDSATVEQCDDSGCGFLGAGNGAPEEKPTESGASE